MADVYSRHRQGILMSSIPGHYAIFNIVGTAQLHPSVNNCKTMKRDMRHQNIKRFEHEIKTVNWNQVLQCDDVGLAYSTFHTVVSENIISVSLLSNHVLMIVHG